MGLGGLWIRARSGPVRDRLMAAMPNMSLPRHRLHPAMGAEDLLGGVDLTETLSSGHVQVKQGLLAAPSILTLTMAERTPPGMAAILAQTLDRHRHGLILLDEAAEEDETPPLSLLDRMGLFTPLDDIAIGETDNDFDVDVPGARSRLDGIIIPHEAAEALTMAAAQMGISSLRAPLFALKAARAHAALSGRDSVETDDLSIAAELCLAHRATHVPAGTSDDDTPEPPPPDPQPEDGDTQGEPSDRPPEDILVAAAMASLPPELLARLAAGRAHQGIKSSAGSGAAQKGNRRGRPLPSRPGKLGGSARVDLVATLRAAAPWQPLRKAMSPRGHGLVILPSDIRVKRYETKSDRLLVFTVDASGSSAMARLAETKGAIELLLAQAYARRDHVALIAFRGEEAELILPPTRSLVQTKRRLAGLPGGGGTPLALGLQAALMLSLQMRSRGMTPTLALLTDGRANVALDGSANRAQAGEDAKTLARSLRGHGITGLVIDTGARPQPALADLARDMDAVYLPLPRADADRMSRAVSAALD